MKVFYSLRKALASKAWGDKKCFICGELFKDGDEIALIIICSEAKRLYKKLSCNVVAHLSEVEELIEAINGNEQDIIKVLGTWKTPRKKSEHSEYQLECREAFEKTADQYGLLQSSSTPAELTYKVPRSSISVSYNFLTDQLRVSTRAKMSIYDMVEQENIRAEIWNAIHRNVGDNKSIQGSGYVEVLKDKATLEELLK